MGEVRVPHPFLKALEAEAHLPPEEQVVGSPAQRGRKPSRWRRQRACKRGVQRAMSLLQEGCWFLGRGAAGAE